MLIASTTSDDGLRGVNRTLDLTMFDWRKFFQQYHIRYVEKGNVSRDNIAIKCPFCTDDPSEHLSVSLRGEGYNCWRDDSHKGRNSAYLVRALLRVSTAEANTIVYGYGGNILPDEDFVTTVKRLLKVEDVKRKTSLEIPSDWRPLSKPTKSIAQTLIYSYLKSRNYSQHDIEAMATRYDLHYATQGPWARRVIFPIRDHYGRIVNFTGRAISKRAIIRYKTTSRDTAAADMSECLFDYYNLTRTRGKALIVCEGPFDAFRLTWIGEPFGIFATCVFTQNVSEVQADKLIRLASNFERSFVLFDKGAELHAIKAQFRLGFDRIKMPQYPNVKDPGDLNGTQALMLCRSLIN